MLTPEKLIIEKKRFGKRVKEIRKEKGLKLQELEFIVGISNGQISRIENGLVNAKFETIARIAEALQVEMIDLFDYDFACSNLYTLNRSKPILLAPEELTTQLLRFGYRIREIRQERIYTLQQLETKSGISNSKLSKIEKGMINTEFQTIVRIAHALEVEMVELFNYDGTLPS